MTQQEIQAKIEKLEKALQNPLLTEDNKKVMRENIAKLKAMLKDEGKAAAEPKKEAAPAAAPSAAPSGEDAEMLKEKIAKWKSKLNDPQLPESAKPKIQSKIDEMEAELAGMKGEKAKPAAAPAKPAPATKAPKPKAEKKPRKESVAAKKKSEAVKKKVKEAKTEAETKVPRKRGRPRKEAAPVKKEAAKPAKKEAKKPVQKRPTKAAIKAKKAMPVKKEAAKPVKKEVKKPVQKRATKAVVKAKKAAKEAVKKPVAKRKTLAELKKEMPRGLKSFINKDKEIRERYKGSTHDLGRDARRGAKPFGWRLAGTNRRPTRAEIKANKAYWEGRPEKADVRRKEYPKLADGGMMAKGGSIGFIPIDLEEDLRIVAKWGGVSIKEVIGILNAMIDTGLTDDDLKPNPTKNTYFQKERAIERKIQEIWKKIEPKYKGSLEGNQYYSTIKELVEDIGNKQILKRFKPFRRFQEVSNASGGMMADGGRVFVGRFDEQQLRKKEDKIAWEKAMKKTGLKYVETKIIKKGGKMFLEVYLIPDEKYYTSNKLAKGGMMADGGLVAYADENYDEIIRRFSNVKSAKDFAKANASKYKSLIFEDEYGDTIVVSQDDTSIDIDMLFSESMDKRTNIEEKAFLTLIDDLELDYHVDEQTYFWLMDNVGGKYKIGSDLTLQYDRDALIEKLEDNGLIKKR